MEEEKSFTPNWKKDFKEKESAVAHIIGMFADCPGCAGLDKTLSIILGTQFIVITPKKKKISYE